MRSNGASLFGGGGKEDRASWKAEGDLAFLPGFRGRLTVGALLVEAAVRYQSAEEVGDLSEILDIADVRQSLLCELKNAPRRSTPPPEGASDAKQGRGRFPGTARNFGIAVTSGTKLPEAAAVHPATSDRSAKGRGRTINDADRTMAGLIKLGSAGMFRDSAHLRAARRMALR